MGEVNETGRGLRLEALLLLHLLTGYALACVCYLVGISLGGWQFWVTFLFVTALAFRQSRRAGLRLLGAYAVLFALTLFTFSYIHCDACSCHLPMSRFLEEGWNPVREASLQTVYAHYADHGITAKEDVLLEFHALHVLVDPKFVQILAAQMQAGCCLFSAAGYPFWFLFCVLALTVRRAATEVFKASRRAGAVLIVLVCCNTEITYGSLRGQVDYVTYAAAMVAALSLLLWTQGRRREDLFLFFAALVIASATKFNGLSTVVLFLGLALVVGWRDREMRRGMALFLVSLALFALLPYWTSAYWFGSPFYPAHTFRSDITLPPGLTNDFLECNDDALRMGYLSRTVYAYVSKPLAVWGCRLWHGASDFNPIWQKRWLTSGYDIFRCMLIWFGLVFCWRCRRREVRLVVGALFLSCLLIPKQYIGFPRYVAQMHGAVVLAWFVAACGSRGWIVRVARIGCWVLSLILLPLFCWHFIEQLLVEGDVQYNARRMKSVPEGYSLVTVDPEVPHQDTWTYVIMDRLSCEGVKIDIDGSGHPLTVDWHMVLQGEGLAPSDDSCRCHLPLPVWK